MILWDKIHSINWVFLVLITGITWAISLHQPEIPIEFASLPKVHGPWSIAADPNQGGDRPAPSKLAQKIYSYGPSEKSVISTKKTPFIEWILSHRNNQL